MKQKKGKKKKDKDEKRAAMEGAPENGSDSSWLHVCCGVLHRLRGGVTAPSCAPVRPRNFALFPLLVTGYSLCRLGSWSAKLCYPWYASGPKTLTELYGGLNCMPPPHGTRKNSTDY